MRKTLSLVFIFGALLFSPAILGTQTAFAFDPYHDACSRADSGASSSVTCKTQSQTTASNDPISGSNGLLSKIANIVALFAGGLAVVIIIFGAIRIVTSNGSVQDQGGKPSAVTSGKNMITGALIGLAIIAFARAIIYFVVKGIN